MDITELIGKTWVAHTRLYLPTGHYVEAGQKFRLLAAHVEAGISPEMWLRAGNAEPIGDEPLHIPGGAPKGKPVTPPVADAPPAVTKGAGD